MLALSFGTSKANPCGRNVVPLGSKDDETAMTFTGRVQATGEARWRASRNDLVFGSNAQLRSIADAYAGSDGQERFVREFVRVWSKVMMLDRYDVNGHKRYGAMAA